MAVVAKTPQINAAAWRNMLLGIWNASPSAMSATAIVRLVQSMLQSALAMHGQIQGDIFIQRSLEPTFTDMRSLQDRLEWYTQRIQEAVNKTPPAVLVNGKLVPSIDRVSMLGANVIGPILNGRFPVDFPAVVMPGPFEGTEELVESMRRGLTEETDGTWRGLPDAVLAVSAWNRIVEAWAVDVAQQDEGYFINLIRQWIVATQVDLQQSAPGEPATTADAVVEVLELIKDKAGEVLKAAWTLAQLFVLGAGLALVLWLFYRSRQRAVRRAA